MKRKVLSILLVCSMLFSLAACGDKSGGESKQPEPSGSNDAVNNSSSDGNGGGHSCR